MLFLQVVAEAFAGNSGTAEQIVSIYNSVSGTDTAQYWNPTSESTSLLKTFLHDVSPAYPALLLSTMGGDKEYAPWTVPLPGETNVFAVHTFESGANTHLYLRLSVVPNDTVSRWVLLLSIEEAGYV